MNGWEFAKEFAAKYDHLCPIIAMTAAADAKQRAKDINAADLIEKPFDFFAGKYPLLPQNFSGTRV